MQFPVLRAALGLNPKPTSATRGFAMPYAPGTYQWGYGSGAPTLQTSWGQNKVDPIASEFTSYVENGLKANGIISAIEMKRFSVFSEARFQFQAFNAGRPGDLFGTPDLSVLERPWPGGTTGDLLTRMLLEADLAGNCYLIRVGDEIVRLRPDWVEIIVADRPDPRADEYEGKSLGYEKVGYLYYHGGKASGCKPSVLTADEVCHFAPYPDPNAAFRGMSWLTPVVREIDADKLATVHKSKFWENAATPNLHVDYPERLKEEDFRRLIDILNENHQGSENAYKTLYTTGGADVTVLGQNMQQMDYKSIVGAGETRLAAAAGVPAVILGLSEGMQGSSLNTGNYQSAKRNFADTTMSALWRNVAGSLEALVPPPNGSRLWFDSRDIAFLRDDAMDRANIQQANAITIRQYTDAGFTPESAVAAVLAEDESLLSHSGLFSVQLQAAGVEPVVPPPARTEVTIAEGAIRNESTFNLPEMTVHNDIDAHAEPADVSVTVPERSVTVTNEAPATVERTATRKRVETDETGRITAIVEEVE